MKTVKSGTAIIAEPKRTAQKGEPMNDLIEIVLIALACPLVLPFVTKKEGGADE